ncbi:MAG: hypothetical protein ACK5CQ_12920 [Cyanobacteriota bacterium]
MDGNKRIGHAALELTLVLSDLELTAGVDAAEAVVLAVASGAMDRETFSQWVMDNHRPRPAV